MEGFFSRTELAVTKRPTPRIADCGRCGLYRNCRSPKMPVAGKGKREILIVGESPGEREDAEGRPFVGPSGQQLQRVLSRFDIDLFRDCWVTNSLICRPGSTNEIKDTRAIDFCRPNVINAIKSLNPRTIILLGAVAIKSVVGAVWKDGVSVKDSAKWTGWQIPLQKWNCWICPTHHPARMLHERNPQRADLIEREWVSHLEAAVTRTKRPWKRVPDWKNAVTVELDDSRAARVIEQYANDYKTLAFDYETTTLKPHGPHAEIVCCSVSNGEFAFAFPWYGRAVDAVAEILRDPKVKKVGANIKFEESWTIRKLGFRVRGWHWDTMLATHALDSRGGITGLKFSALVRLGMEDYSSHVEPYLKADSGNVPNRIRELPIKTVCEYCALDSLLEFRLAKLQMGDFRDAV